MKKRIAIIVIAFILLAVALKSFYSPPSFYRLLGSNVAMQGPTGIVFRVPLTGAEKVQLTLYCFLSREINEEELATATADDKAQNAVIVYLDSDPGGAQLLLSYYPAKNLTVMS